MAMVLPIRSITAFTWPILIKKITMMTVLATYVITMMIMMGLWIS